MKNLFSQLLFVLFASFTLFQCQTTDTKDKEMAKAISIQGKVTDATEKKFYLSSTFGGEEIEIAEEYFSKSLPALGPMIININYQRNGSPIYAKPGDVLEVNFTENQFDTTFQLESPYELENAFLREVTDTLDSGMGSDFWANYKLSEEEYIKKVEGVKAKGIAMFNSFKEKNKDVDPDFLELMEVQINYQMGSQISNYPNYHRYVAKEDTAYQESEELKQKIAALEKEDPKLLGLAAYTNVLKSKKRNLVAELMKEDTSIRSGGMKAYYTAEAKIVEEAFEAPEIKEFLKFDYINSQIMFDGLDRVEEQYQNFVANSNNEALKSKLAVEYNKWAHLKSGSVAPDFSYPNIDSLIQSLSDFKGKYVYIDVWATWCGPCIAEQPHLEKIEKQYEENDNIVFMGVSIDEDKEAWKKMVQEKEMHGVQLIADDAWSSSINKDYNIKGIPRFILVDPDGNLVNASAARPSSDELKDQLKKLLTSKPVKG